MLFVVFDVYLENMCRHVSLIPHETMLWLRYVRPPYPTRAPSIDLMVNDLKRRDRSRVTTVAATVGPDRRRSAGSTVWCWKELVLLDQLSSVCATKVRIAQMFEADSACKNPVFVDGSGNSIRVSIRFFRVQAGKTTYKPDDSHRLTRRSR